MCYNIYMALSDSDKKDVRDIVVGALETIVLPRFDQQDTRMDGLDTRMDGLESRMGKMESRMDKIELRLDTVESHLRDTSEDVRQIKQKLERLEGKVEALEADIKEIYLTQSRLEKRLMGGDKFAKLTLEKKLLQLNSNLLATAKEAGITLPR